MKILIPVLLLILVSCSKILDPKEWPDYRLKTKTEYIAGHGYVDFIPEEMLYDGNYRYEYNSRNQVICIRHFIPTDLLYEYWEYYYTKDTLVYSLRYHANSNWEHTVFDSTVYEYCNGLLILEKSCHVIVNLEDVIKYQYLPDGRIKQIVYQGITDNKIVQFEYEKDKIIEKHYYQDEICFRTIEHMMWGDLKLISAFFDSGGNLIRTKMYEYNDADLIISEKTIELSMYSSSPNHLFIYEYEEI